MRTRTIFVIIHNPHGNDVVWELNSKEYKILTEKIFWVDIKFIKVNGSWEEYKNL